LAAAFGLARRLGEARCRPGHAGAQRRRRRPHRARLGARFAARELLRGAARRAPSVLSLQVVSTGSVDAAPVHPREVFSPAIRDGAAAVVVAHNHPSGDPTPSAEDRPSPSGCARSASWSASDLLDHLVVGAERYYSFAEEGYFPIA
jgi:DNA repair protein RadC